jgi:hypothetical protein
MGVAVVRVAATVVCVAVTVVWFVAMVVWVGGIVVWSVATAVTVGGTVVWFVVTGGSVVILEALTGSTMINNARNRVMRMTDDELTRDI